MEEDEEVASVLGLGGVRLSIRDVVKLHAISDFVERMFKTLDGLLGEVPELIACYKTFSYLTRTEQP